jgi:hypothetical protein
VVLCRGEILRMGGQGGERSQLEIYNRMELERCSDDDLSDAHSTRLRDYGGV